MPLDEPVPSFYGRLVRGVVCADRRVTLYEPPALQAPFSYCRSCLVFNMRDASLSQEDRSQNLGPSAWASWPGGSDYGVSKVVWLRQ